MTAAATPDVLALLRACRTAPDEDTPRLMLADAVEESGFTDAAAYMRTSLNLPRGQRAPKKPMGMAYLTWLEAVFAEASADPLKFTSIGEKHQNYIIAGTGWNQFVWIGSNDRRRCVIDIDRGLPSGIHVTCPMLVERATLLFIFPLTCCRVIDRRPEQCPVFGSYRWEASTLPQKFNTWEEDQTQIPLEFWRFLPEAGWDDGPSGTDVGRLFYNKAEFATSKKARAALDAAALEYGRAIVNGNLLV